MTPWRTTVSLAHPLRDATLRPALTAADWEKQLAEREQTAFENGVVMGERAMSEQLLRLRSEVSELQKGVLDSLRHALPQIIKDSEAGLIALALEAARKFVAGLPVSAERVEAVVREALEQVEETTDFSVHLHPEDLALLQKVNSPILEPIPGGAKFHFQSSPEVSRGGCLVHTRFGLIDAQPETKLKQLEQTLTA